MGYRLRMTLAFALLSVASVVVFAMLFLSSSYQEFKAHRIASVERMTSCLAGNVYWDMQAGDTERVREALERFSRGVPAAAPPAVVVLDPEQRIYTSAADRSGEAATGELGFGLSLIAAGLEQEEQKTITVESADGFVCAARVERDGQQLGTVLVNYPLSSLDAHFVNMFKTAIGYSLGLLALLLAVGWLVGRRMMRPIRHLHECMQRVGRGDLEVQCHGIGGNDEIGALARGFEEMVQGLREKRLLEKEMLSTERLAAVGQVAAGVAHEINNPLGGLINAVGTFKRHGDDPRVMHKTVDLLERGLKQIQDTVSALLVQARVEVHALTPADLQDLHTLVAAQVKKKAVRLDWRCELTHKLPLPSTAVRQVLMNLLLNAIQVVPERGRVAMTCAVEGRHLFLRVEDNGPGIAEEEVDRLFEPFFSRTGGHGLGLWVTYQVISQLGGSIEVKSLGPGTAMEVRLPFSPVNEPDGKK
jgi:two-component system NtrC family sensor kinase